MRGRISTVVLTALLVPAGAIGASARQPRLGRCALMPHARVVVRTPEVVVSSVPHTEVVDAVPVTNPTYYTCLSRTGERKRLFVASSDPSPDAGYHSYVAAFRAAGHYVLYISAFIQNNPEGQATESAGFHVVDVAHHDRPTIALPDPNIGLIGLGEVALSVDGYMAWALVNAKESGTTETIEADIGGGPITVATAAIPDTLAQLAFHKLAFHGETLTWLYDGRHQSAQLKRVAGSRRTFAETARTRTLEEPPDVRVLASTDATDRSKAVENRAQAAGSRALGVAVGGARLKNAVQPPKK